MNLLGSCYTSLSIVHYIAQDRGLIFVTAKIHETDLINQETNRISLQTCLLYQRVDVTYVL